jgi:hypothetical protein
VNVTVPPAEVSVAGVTLQLWKVGDVVSGAATLTEPQLAVAVFPDTSAALTEMV